METNDQTTQPTPSPGATCSASSELLETLQEWAEEFRLSRHPASLTIYRAIQRIRETENAGKWIKATDINYPGGWYWTRLNGNDESCPQIVFVALENDGDAAPDFVVEHIGEDCHKAKRLNHYAAQDWEFMPVPMPDFLLNH
jgi:hypothetical protein